MKWTSAYLSGRNYWNGKNGFNKVSTIQDKHVAFFLMLSQRFSIFQIQFHIDIWVVKFDRIDEQSGFYDTIWEGHPLLENLLTIPIYPFFIFPFDAFLIFRLFIVRFFVYKFYVIWSELWQKKRATFQLVGTFLTWKVK